MKRLTFYYNSDKCSGCKTCQIACKDKNNLDIGIKWRRVYEITGGDWEKKGNAWVSNVIAYNLSISCNHCEDPICMKSCPAKAISKNENGIVEIDQDKCLGCKYCQWSCPYSAPQYLEKKGVMSKCNMCADYVEKGLNPVCVDACPTRALDFGDFDELVKKYGNHKHIHPLPNQNITSPSIIINPHKDALKKQNNNSQITNMEEIKNA